MLSLFFFFPSPSPPPPFPGPAGLARDGVVVDMFGVVGENGKDTAHFFQDGRAERKKDVAQAKCVWSAADWDVDSKKTTSAPALGDGALEAPSGYDAAVWLGRDPFIIATTTTTTSTTTTTVRAATDATTIATTVADTTTVATTVADATTVATTVAGATTVATTVADATTVATASTPTAVVTQVATTASAGRVVTVATAAPPSTSGESQARIDVANATTTATAAATTVGQDINREPGATTEGQESNRGPAGKESKAKKAKKGGADSLKKESQSSGAQAKGGKGKGKGGKGKGGQGDGAFEARAANATGAEAKATLGGPQPKGKGKEPKSPKKVKVGKMLQGPELRATSRGRNIVPDINTGLLSLAAVFVVAAAVVVVAGFKFAAKSSPDTVNCRRRRRLAGTAHAPECAHGAAARAGIIWPVPPPLCVPPSLTLLPCVRARAPRRACQQSLLHLALWCTAVGRAPAAGASDEQRPVQLRGSAGHGRRRRVQGAQAGQ